MTRTLYSYIVLRKDGSAMSIGQDLFDTIFDAVQAAKDSFVFNSQHYYDIDKVSDVVYNVYAILPYNRGREHKYTIQILDFYYTD